MPDKRPRGALPSPRHKLAAAMPHIPSAPAPANYLVIPAQLSFWGNQTDGDCVTAEEAFAKACHQPEIFITEAIAVAWAGAHDYLNGAVLSDVLDTMLNDGFQQGGQQYDDGAANTVDWTNAAILNSAISQGPVKIGVAADQLENVVTSQQNGWFATGFARDENEDHCVSLCGYGSIAWLAGQMNVAVPDGVDGSQPGYALFTWSSVGIIDAASMVAITHEAWLRRPTTIVH
ncbi:hypothetical protein [Phenylobacterium sp.]|jgi:hypothetical protein|uniref:hypothetical protein n=1 Tax=Phenylobacterium sp. TaxID=1871053 RepID=UPI002F40471D